MGNNVFIPSLGDATQPRSAQHVTDNASETIPPPSPESDIDRDYQTVKTALDKKPALLHRILGATLQHAQRELASMNNPDAQLKPDAATRLADVEKQYRKHLEKNSEALFEAYQRLPIGRKIDLLVQSEEIAEDNDRARKQAKMLLVTAQTEAIARQHAALAHREVASQPRVPLDASHQPANQAARSAAQPDVAMPQPNPSQPHPQTSSDKTSIAPAEPKTPPNKSLLEHVGIGNPAAITVNLPFTVIPGLPALNSVLQKIDHVAHLDLGFTLKGVADRKPNPDGGYDVLYRMTYLGGGIMSSKFNVQAAPFNLTLEERADAEGWGGSSSVFTKRRSDLIGEKVSINFGRGDVGVSFAAEANYQKPSNRMISNFTGGRYFSEDGPALRIPAKYVNTVTNLVEALPSDEEVSHIVEHIARVVPVDTMFRLGEQAITQAARNTGLAQPAMDAARYLLAQAVSTSGLSPAQQHAVMSMIEENVDRHPEFPAVKLREQVTPDLHPQHEP